MKTNIIGKYSFYLFFLCVSCNCNELDKVGKVENNKMSITASISDSFINRVVRSLNVNKTIVVVEFKNSSNENITIQKPISRWNLFLTLIDNDNQKIHSSVIEFINPVIDSSIYMQLQPSEKRMHEFRFSNFGIYHINFSKIKRVILNYSPQDVYLNETKKGFIDEHFMFELILK